MLLLEYRSLRIGDVDATKSREESGYLKMQCWKRMEIRWRSKGISEEVWYWSLLWKGKPAGLEDSVIEGKIKGLKRMGKKLAANWIHKGKMVIPRTEGRSTGEGRVERMILEFWNSARYYYYYYLFKIWPPISSELRYRFKYFWLTLISTLYIIKNKSLYFLYA